MKKKNTTSQTDLEYLYSLYLKTVKSTSARRAWVIVLPLLSILVLACLISHRIVWETHNTCNHTDFLISIICLIVLFVCFFLHPLFIYIEAKSTEGMLRCKNAIKRQRMLERKASANKDTSEYEDEYEVPEQSDDEYPEQ